MSDAKHNHVLLVDDSEGGRFAMARMLQVAGFHVTEAATGTEGLRLAREMPDLVVLDIRLPDMSGYDVCRTIKSDPATAAIPILHVSASFVRAEDQAHGLEGGADGYLTEPVDRVVLVATVRALIRARRAEAQAREARRVAESASRAKDKFLATLSHELRTPLTPALMSVAALAADHGLPEPVRQELAMVRRNLELEVALIDDLLDLSRATNGKLSLQLQPLSAHELIGDVLTICTSDVRAKGLEIQTDFRAPLDVIRVDSARVRQVFWNLLKNAIKFTPEGGQITISSEADDRVIRVSVRDSGVGIAAESLSRIFDAFDQGAADGGTRPAGGLGLGLTIAKAIVDQHHGAITAESAGAGAGAVFTVTLPLEADAAALPRLTPTQPSANSVQPLRILLVEDHVDTAATLSRLLGYAGHRVRSAGTVASALTLAAEEDFDVVISDIGLPDRSGYELMRELKARHGLKGIALSGYGMEDDLHRGHDAGFHDYIVKPVNIDRLESAIQAVSGRS